MMKYTIAIAGSTAHTRMCAEALTQGADADFEIVWILTPEPKVLGRQQILTKNPLHLFAEEHQIPVITIAQKIDENVRAQIETQPRPDFLLVVDFGYLVPDWLLEFPKIAPLNIHPSLLPRWRGSSPGQFVLLFGEKNSAITLMVMNAGLDTGPIIHQEMFAVDPEWTQTEYYQASFAQMCGVLCQKIRDFAEGKISAQPQPADSPTPLARRLTKEDGFVSWESVQSNIADPSNQLLNEIFAANNSWPQTLVNATASLNPWPTLWTIIPTTKGPKRMQILRAQLDKTTQKLVLDLVKIEGQSEAKWAQVKNILNE